MTRANGTVKRRFMIYLDTALARKLQERVLDEGSDISTVIGDALENHLTEKDGR